MQGKEESPHPRFFAVVSMLYFFGQEMVPAL
jgi:hypothetical protein